MLLNYYKLAEQPFGVTPDPRFLYSSPTHREAIASVLHSVKSGRGFTALIAEPGMGKTTVLFNLLQQLEGMAKTAFLFQSHDNPRNFLRNLLLDLGIEDDGQDLVRMQVKLNECLVHETSQGKYFVVVIDEAQNLDEPVLEVVRMLSNFETPSEKLMHIILAGQPQLAEKLASPQLKQLRQRVSIVAHMKPFNAEGTRAYIEHRLSVAGYREEMPLFTDRAFALIAEYSGGIPRNINNICFNAMSLGCVMRRKTIHAAAVEEVLRDLDLKPLSTRVQVAEYSASAANAIGTRSVAEKLGTIFPKAWRVRVGLASLLALMAGIGLTVVARNPHNEAAGTNAVIAPPIAAASITQEQVGDVTPVADRVRDAKNVNVADSSSAIANSPSAAVLRERIENPAMQSVVIRVGRQDTLYEICVENLGRYDDEVVKMIRELNPGFGNPRRLQVGQEIRIPTPRSVLARATVSAEGYENTSAVEAKKP